MGRATWQTPTLSSKLSATIAAFSRTPNFATSAAVSAGRKTGIAVYSGMLEAIYESGLLAWRSLSRPEEENMSPESVPVRPHPQRPSTARRTFVNASPFPIRHQFPHHLHKSPLARDRPARAGLADQVIAEPQGASPSVRIRGEHASTYATLDRTQSRSARAQPPGRDLLQGLSRDVVAREPQLAPSARPRQRPNGILPGACQSVG
jgi:hypothetical protein